MAVSLVGTHHGPGDALGHFLVVLLGNDSLGVWISMTTGTGGQVPIKGNGVPYDRSLPRGGIMSPGYHYGLPGTNAGEHLYGGNYSYLSCLPRVPIRCRKPSGSTL
jgi:hypothetical protein